MRLRIPFKKIMREHNARGMLILLQVSKDPLSLLRAHRRHIDDAVVEMVLDYTYYISQTETIERVLWWLDIADEASRLGGTALATAGCQLLRAELLMDLYSSREQEADGSTANRQVPPRSLPLLDEALNCVLKAIEIYEQAGMSSELVQGLVTAGRVYLARGELIPALRSRVACAVQLVSAPKGEQWFPKALKLVINLFWKLEDDVRIGRGHVTMERAIELQEGASRWCDDKEQADLMDVLAAANRGLQRPDEAYNYWERALLLYEKVGSKHGQFFVFASMQDLAWKLERAEKIVEYGERSVLVCPPDIRPGLLASRYHLLAFGYEVLERITGACAAYHQAIELYLEDKEDPDSTSDAGCCLLQVGALELRREMFAQALEDLERANGLPGGVYGFWLAYIDLADVYRRGQGDLGRAIEHAERAVQLSISHEFNQNLQALGLYISAELYYSSGNAAKALSQTELALTLGPVRPTFETIHIDGLFSQAVFVPARWQGYLLALLASRRMGHSQKSTMYAELYTASISREENLQYAGLYDEDDEDDEDERDRDEYDELDRAMELLAQGERLLLTDVHRAVATLEESVALLESAGADDTLVIPLRLLGTARFSLNDVKGTRTCLLRAIGILRTHPNVAEEVNCRFGLARIHIEMGDWLSAYNELHATLAILEVQRVSLRHPDQRLLFGGNLSAVYDDQMTMCLLMGRAGEALEMTERARSRLFLDLLDQPTWRQIDYQALERIQALARKRQGWTREFAGSRFLSASQIASSLFSTFSEQEVLAMLDRSIGLDSETALTREELEGRDLLVSLESDAIPLSFQAIKELIA